MAIWCLGSVNADHIYRVPRLARAGETLAADQYDRELGGKGANMAIAAARAGANVHLIGAVGSDGGWMRDEIAGYGVCVDHVDQISGASGHAVIMVEPGGENQITIFAGANRCIGDDAVRDALGGTGPGDLFVCQNETNLQRESADMARQKGLKIVYAAAPFQVSAARAMLDVTDVLVLNAVEAGQLESALGQTLDALSVEHVIVTLGRDGVRWVDNTTGISTVFPAVPVVPVDTTGAGDTFTGYFLAALDQSSNMKDAILLAVKAAAMKVTRHGTARAIPTRAEVDRWTP
ncbi:MAG: ribokinase [Pseudooceanicola sp.]